MVSTKINVWCCTELPTVFVHSTQISHLSIEYDMFRAKQGNVSPAHSPPCKDTLSQHTKRASFQEDIRKKNLQIFPDITNPTEGHIRDLVTKDSPFFDKLYPLHGKLLFPFCIVRCTRSCFAEAVSYWKQSLALQLADAKTTTVPRWKNMKILFKIWKTVKAIRTN